MDDDINDILAEFDKRSVPSSTQDLNDLTKQWIAERGAPEVLPYQGPLLERIMERIREQIEIVERETGDLEPNANFRLILIQTELERVKFLVRAYLRARMAKIDKHPLYLINNPSALSHLSDPEKAYLRSHLALLNNHYLSSFLRNFPAQLRRLDDAAGGVSMVEEPDLDSAVFCRVVRVLEEGEELVVKGTDARVELMKGDVVVVRYRAVRKWVLGGEVELI
ncbi:GINS complex, Sld5 component [Terfezia boudieri ATCC MYA-4762]|uniref:DNA replication complex GINS protein SLD5 n=1 Tax=Terfezia boudieri ATCC MYA-4762 TaxID=1051890 RepID=A0A3N4LT96_9PEZI|nr:GINS complex, Sld5 component [Terfezia boudieri ATCC MYA-4762]